MITITFTDEEGKAVEKQLKLIEDDRAQNFNAPLRAAREHLDALEAARIRFTLFNAEASDDTNTDKADQARNTAMRWFHFDEDFRVEEDAHVDADCDGGSWVTIEAWVPES